MLDFIPSCFRRHKKKLLFVGGVVGGIAFFNTYLRRKFIEWETQRTSDMCDQLKKASHFENTMITCDGVFTTFTEKIREVVISEVDVLTVVEELKSNPPNKILLWERLKILVFTQIMGEMYANCVLCILLRVQMCILSGYIFATRSTSADATDQQTKYMSHIQDFILNGVTELLVHVRKACTQSLKDHSLSEPLRLKDISEIVEKVQDNISVTDLKLLPDISYVLMSPSTSKRIKNDKDDFLNNISVETKDVFECEDFKRVLDICIESGISFIMDLMYGCYSRLSGKEEFTNINTIEVPLAKLIPEIHNAFMFQNPAGDDALARKLIQLEKLNNFAANIYEAFSHKSC